MKTEARLSCPLRQVNPSPPRARRLRRTAPCRTGAPVPFGLVSLAPLILAAGCYSGAVGQPAEEIDAASASDGDLARSLWPGRSIPGARSDMPPWSGPEDPSTPGGRARRPDGPPEAFTAIDPAELRRRLWTEPPPTFYVPPSAERSAAVAAMIRAILATPTPEPEDLGELAYAAGFEIHAWYVSGQRLLAAVEPPNRQTGAGAYLIRVGPGSERPVILQAPHAFHDIGTERIALALTLRGHDWPRALFVNTIHRYLDIDGARRERDGAPADPCHNPDHLFSVATAAALSTLPHAEIVQIHGFDEGGDPLGPAVVVSAGDRAAATVRTREVAERVRTALGVEVALFPVDRTRLGATTNAQGRLVRARGRSARFVHIELSPDLRRRLQRDARALAGLAEALRPDDRDPEETLAIPPADRPL